MIGNSNKKKKECVVVWQGTELIFTLADMKEITGISIAAIQKRLN